MNLSLKEKEKEETQIIYLHIQNLTPDPQQPRKFFDQEKLEELSQSLNQHGCLTPLIVKPLLAPHRYQIIAGERRWRAAKLSSLTHLPCLVKDVNQQTQQEIALIENIQRADLSPLEEAKAFLKLSQNLTHDEIAQRLGKKRSSISNTLRLLDLSPFIQDLLEQKKLEKGHAKVLLTIEQEELRDLLAQEAAEKNWSVRELEKKSQKEKKSPYPSPEPPPSDRDRDKLTEELKGLYGTQVLIKGQEQGSIEFRFYSPEDLVRLTDKLTKIFS